MAFFSRIVSGLCVLAYCLVVPSSGLAQQQPQNEDFPGVKKALTPEQFGAAGLNKLSAEERARLDEYLRAYVSGATQRVAQQAASQAVSQAVKENRVAPPQLVESRIVGTINHINDRTVFVLENGERWKVADGQVRSFAPLTNPPIFIVKDFFSYKMALPGAGIIRVQKL